MERPGACWRTDRQQTRFALEAREKRPIQSQANIARHQPPINTAPSLCSPALASGYPLIPPPFPLLDVARSGETTSHTVSAYDLR